jgi:hypothetical protein
MLIDKNLILQAATTKTADFQSEKLAVDITNSYVGQAVIYVTAVADNVGDETYLMSLEVSDGTNWRKVGAVNIPKAVPGKYVIPFSGATAGLMDIAASIDGVRLNLDVTGSTPSCAFSGYLGNI